jgi:hypothetical protein
MTGLTCLTRDFIVQASDRRLLYQQGKKIARKEDDCNKALMYENYAVFAYTGLATLSNQKVAQEEQRKRKTIITKQEECPGWLPIAEHVLSTRSVTSPLVRLPTCCTWRDVVGLDDENC